jgi:hypothetical protein
MKMSREHAWNDTDTDKLKYPEKNLSQCQFILYKPHIDRAGSNAGFKVRTCRKTA